MCPREGPVGVLGGEPVQLAVANAASASGRQTVTGSVSTVLEQDVGLVIVSDLGALSALLLSKPQAPILPVGVPETGGISPTEVEAAVEQILEGAGVIEDHPVLKVETATREFAALYDLSLMTGEPARISEYAVTAGGDRQDVTHVRADGMVVATPLGSQGYGQRAGAPRVHPGIDGVAVIPVSPFAVALEAHLVPPPISISLERDEGEVELFADSRLLGTVERTAPVTISAAGTVRVVSLDEKT